LGIGGGVSLAVLQLAYAVGANVIAPIIDSEFPLADSHAAPDRLESGQQSGKMRLRVQSP
jgi:NADPH:quinone reductase-like Zn-dependent oxidoreductase